MTSNLSALFNNAKKVTLVSVPEKEESEDETVDDEEEEEEVIETPRTKIKQEHEDEGPMITNDETVFVGNVPMGTTQKELKKLFSEFGTIKTIRLRNLIPLHPKRGKRLAFIKKEFHPLQKTITAFIRFSDEEEAQNATCLNGDLYKEHHLRVDMARDHNEDTRHDNLRSVFIGNLPFDANNDDVWNAFEDCGEIENVRLVRDRATSVGKGFGYVLFKDEASVALALRMNGNCKIANREIRIKTAVRKPKTVKSNTLPIRRRQQNEKFEMRKSNRSKDNDGIQQGRVGKRPALKLKKEKQKMKKKNLSLKTNNTRKDVIQLKRKT